jgi:hypothetical protein
MEESILELKKNSTVNQTATSPESDRTGNNDDDSLNIDAGLLVD